jgi:hypothetical protein
MSTKQDKAFWRACERHSVTTTANPLVVVPKNTPYHFDCERRRSFASGWIAGIKWYGRNRKPTKENK